LPAAGVVPAEALVEKSERLLEDRREDQEFRDCDDELRQ